MFMEVMLSSAPVVSSSRTNQNTLQSDDGFLDAISLLAGATQAPKSASVGNTSSVVFEPVNLDISNIANLASDGIACIPADVVEKLKLSNDPEMKRLYGLLIIYENNKFRGEYWGCKRAVEELSQYLDGKITKEQFLSDGYPFLMIVITKMIFANIGIGNEYVENQGWVNNENYAVLRDYLDFIDVTNLGDPGDVDVEYIQKLVDMMLLLRSVILSGRKEDENRLAYEIELFIQCNLSDKRPNIDKDRLNLISINVPMYSESDTDSVKNDFPTEKTPLLFSFSDSLLKKLAKLNEPIVDHVLRALSMLSQIGESLDPEKYKNIEMLFIALSNGSVIPGSPEHKALIEELSVIARNLLLDVAKIASETNEITRNVFGGGFTVAGIEYFDDRVIDLSNSLQGVTNRSSDEDLDYYENIAKIVYEISLLFKEYKRTGKYHSRIIYLMTVLEAIMMP